MINIAVREYMQKQIVAKKKRFFADRQSKINGKYIHPNGGTEERKSIMRGEMYVGVMMRVVMVMMMVSHIRTTSRSRLLRMDRHRHAGQSFSLPKPVPFHAEKQNYRPVSSKCIFIQDTGKTFPQRSNRMSALILA